MTEPKITKAKPKKKRGWIAWFLLGNRFSDLTPSGKFIYIVGHLFLIIVFGVPLAKSVLGLDQELPWVPALLSGLMFSVVIVGMINLIITAFKWMVSSSK